MLWEAAQALVECDFPHFRTNLPFSRGLPLKYPERNIPKYDRVTLTLTDSRQRQHVPPHPRLCGLGCAGCARDGVRTLGVSFGESPARIPPRFRTSAPPPPPPYATPAACFLPLVKLHCQASLPARLRWAARISRLSSPTLASPSVWGTSRTSADARSPTPPSRVVSSTSRRRRRRVRFALRTSRAAMTRSARLSAALDPARPSRPATTTPTRSRSPCSATRAACAAITRSRRRPATST